MRYHLTMGLVVALVATCVLSACAGPMTNEFLAGTPGFFIGLIHGFIAPFALMGELIHHFLPVPDLKLFQGLRIYAEPNSGIWYDVGYILGVSCWTQGPYVIRRQRGKLDR